MNRYFVVILLHKRQMYLIYKSILISDTITLFAEVVKTIILNIYHTKFYYFRNLDKIKVIFTKIITKYKYIFLCTIFNIKTKYIINNTLIE